MAPPSRLTALRGGRQRGRCGRGLGEAGALGPQRGPSCRCIAAIALSPFLKKHVCFFLVLFLYFFVWFFVCFVCVFCVLYFFAVLFFWLFGMGVYSEGEDYFFGVEAQVWGLSILEEILIPGGFFWLFSLVCSVVVSLFV